MAEGGEFTPTGSRRCLPAARAGVPGVLGAPAFSATYKAFRDIEACRTAALGTQVQQCDHCGRQQIAYRSCRNRHCPKCHSRTLDEWLLDRVKEVLPVPY